MPAIQATGLTKYYGDVRGVEDLTFSVEEGEAFGYLGPNGAGKTTTIRTLLGFIAPTDGTASVLGADVRDAAALRAARKRIGYLPAEPGLDESATGRELIRLHAGLKGDRRSDDLAALFDAPLDRAVGDYSRGNRQKLAIVLAFMHEPDLVLMDEPTSGLDPLMQERFYDFLDAERERGVTLFISSHILGEVRRVCERVGIVRDGRFVTVESVSDLLDRAGKHVSLRVKGEVDPDDFAFEGVHDLSVDTTTTFTLTGGYDDLVDALDGYHVVDLEIEEAPLEEVFMRFYGEDDTGRVEEVVA
ncbi:ABC transporter ATP-binding protein [Halorarius halobius]|uniref:ABC transporter ATP-binding protein n=1 Tax=Halorarius halobius TaxID=2962671 RepID=UPI0020CEC570|nr:ABC transporter ATP-binding protein [Halorarius halobius]